jgi:hypothetical protein
LVDLVESMMMHGLAKPKFIASYSFDTGGIRPRLNLPEHEDALTGM